LKNSALVIDQNFADCIVGLNNKIRQNKCFLQLVSKFSNDWEILYFENTYVRTFAFIPIARNARQSRLRNKILPRQVARIRRSPDNLNVKGVGSILIYLVKGVFDIDTKGTYIFTERKGQFLTDF
jgi:hypothetical protein